MEAKAISRFARFAPRKVNQILSLIRNKPVGKAVEALMFSPKLSRRLVLKTLHSAIANTGKAKNPEGLKVKSCWVGVGPTLKRMRPGPMGRGMPYKRKMCHLTVIVSEMTPAELNKKRKHQTEEKKDK